MFRSKHFASRHFKAVWPSVTGWLPVSLTVGSPQIGQPEIHQKHALLPNPLTVSSPAFGQGSLQQRHVLLANLLTTLSPSIGTPELHLRYLLASLGFSVQPPVIGSPEFEAFSQEITGILQAMEAADNASMAGLTAAIGALSVAEAADVASFYGISARPSEHLSLIGRANSIRDLIGRGGRRDLH